MKTGLLLLTVALLAGIGTGYAWTRRQFGPLDAALPAGNQTAAANLANSGAKPGEKVEAGNGKVEPEKFPRVEVLGSTTFEFGSLELDGKMKHVFRVRNAGDAPLILKLLETSCKCTLADVPSPRLGPGAETNVVLEWTGKGKIGPYTQAATIETNDPTRPILKFTVKGLLTGAYYLYPQELTFTAVKANEAVGGEFFFVALAEPNVAQPKVEWRDPTTAAYYHLEFTPLSAEELVKNDNALSGWKGKLTIRPDLPLGDFRQVLLLTLPLKDSPTSEVTIQGTVVGQASVVGGKGWYSERQMLNFEIVKKGTGARSEGVYILLRGDQRETSQPKLVETYPPYLQLEFDKAEFLGELNQTKIPLTVVIPPTSLMESHLGDNQGRLGRLVIDTGIPNHPKLRILIRYAVE